MIEFQDGAFDEPEELEKKMKKLADIGEAIDRVKALHVGSEEYLLAIKEKRCTDEIKIIPECILRIEELEKNVNKLLIALSLDDPDKILIVGG